MELIHLIIFLIIVFFSNFFASIVGGASLLILPAMLILGIPADITVATNRFHRVFATGTSSITYLRKIKVNYKLLFWYCLISIIGGVLGAFIVLSLNESILKLIVSIFLLILGVYFIFNKDLGIKDSKAKPNKLVSYIVLFILGVYRTIVGSAAGTFTRAYLIISDKLTFLQSATFGSTIGFAINIFASIVFIFAGIIDYWLAFYMIIVGILGSYLGAKTAMKKGNKFIRRLFLLLVVIISIRLLISVIFGK
tara:strand:+ start:1602 stop:2357 length:756 start_codon:yes stop_codon:yes gene_type:complete